MARQPMPDYGRQEKRYSANLVLNLSCAPRQVLAEPVYTENISINGARILSKRGWSRDEKLQVECIRWDFRSTARVAYCESLQDEQFAVGLQFLPKTPGKSQDDSPWPPLTR